MDDIRKGVFCILCSLYVATGFVFGQHQIVSDTLDLSEIEITGKRRPFYSIESLTARRIEVLPVRDIGDLLRQEPNVSGIRKGGVGIDPVIRGFKYNQVTVLMNGGVKIEGGCPNRMDPVAAHVESENIRNIEVIKGPYVLKYGPVMGALVNLNTTGPEVMTKPGIHGELIYGFESNWNGQREHISLWGGNRRFTLQASGGFKGYGSYTAGNDKLFNTSFQKIYGNAGAGITLAENHRLTLSYAYNEGRNILFPALPMDERLDQTHVARVHYLGKQLSSVISSVEFQAYASPVHHVMDNLNKPTAKTMQAVTTVDAMNTGGKFATGMVAGKHRITAGLDYEYVWKDGDKQMTMKMIMEGDTFISVKHANVWLNAVTSNAGIFGEYNVTIGKFELTAALRMDYNQATSGDTFRLVKNEIHYFDDLDSRYMNFSFGIGVRRPLAQWFSVRAGIGRGTRSPSVLERYIKLMPVQYDSYDYLGNPQLKPETNYQADLNFDIMTQLAGTVTLGGFTSVITNYITGVALPPSVIKPSTQGAPGVRQFSNADHVWLYGFEAGYHSPRTTRWDLHAQVAATWGIQPDAVKYQVTNGQVTGEETIHNDPLPEIPPLEGTLRFAWRFFTDKLVPGLTIRMVSPQKRVSQSYGELSTPGFVTAACSVTGRPWPFLSVTAGIDNIFNTPYYEHLNRRIVGSSERLYEPGRVFYLVAKVKI